MSEREAPGELVGLRAEVDEAWAGVLACRSKPARARVPESIPAQRRFLAALESYAAALDEHGYPLPHPLRRELIVYRSLLCPPRSHRGQPLT
jgi:hypothetical protein